jgi:putative toxin-antitoxin system antitoxin component (TIGR02293 family)
MSDSNLEAVTEKAVRVFGSKAAAERWLVAPVIGLDRCRPLDMLRDPEGVARVEISLIRMDYCVYA